ncbi:hypothetical protein MNBD_GAMMA13-395 [hydrothermal vent metagenome]|uniref:Two-component transcriptional response regulator, LuxR family n=1 Tax=hydrothermal vent metagenome TaxID=652676 RepID=A0A3B0Z1R3_9ZZZZ
MADPVDILLVDSRRLVRSGIERVLNDSGRFRVCAGVSSFDEAIRLARSQAPRIMLVNLPGLAVDLLDGARKIQRQFAEISVIVLADEADFVVQERLLQSGVAGIVNSSCSVEELYSAIETVARGGRFISDTLAQKLAERRLPGGQISPFDSLTHRELQILLLVTSGENTATIARGLCLTQKTVNSYRNRLLEKLQAKTEVELMHLALRHGLVSIPGHIF